MAFWGYSDQVLVNYPKATRMIEEFYYRPHKDAMGPYWQQPGRSIVQDKLRVIQSPETEWEVERIEYEPGTAGSRSGEGTIFMEQRMTVVQNMSTSGPRVVSTAGRKHIRSARAGPLVERATAPTIF